MATPRPGSFLARDGMPVALVDWDTTGPVGRKWDVAQAAWLNCQLHDDEVPASHDLPARGSSAFLCTMADRFTEACLEAVQDPLLLALPLVGSVDQVAAPSRLLLRPRHQPLSSGLGGWV